MCHGVCCLSWIHVLDVLSESIGRRKVSICFRSLAIRRAPCQLTPISSRYSLKVLRYVFFSLPLFLLPFSGTQYIAVCAGLSLCSRMMQFSLSCNNVLGVAPCLPSSSPLHCCTYSHFFLFFLHIDILILFSIIM